MMRSNDLGNRLRRRRIAAFAERQCQLELNDRIVSSLVSDTAFSRTAADLSSIGSESRSPCRRTCGCRIAQSMKDIGFVERVQTIERVQHVDAAFRPLAAGELCTKQLGRFRLLPLVDQPQRSHPSPLIRIIERIDQLRPDWPCRATSAPSSDNRSARRDRFGPDCRSKDRAAA